MVAGRTPTGASPATAAAAQSARQPPPPQLARYGACAATCRELRTAQHKVCTCTVHLSAELKATLFNASSRLVCRCMSLKHCLAHMCLANITLTRACYASSSTLCPLHDNMCRACVVSAAYLRRLACRCWALAGLLCTLIDLPGSKDRTSAASSEPSCSRCSEPPKSLSSHPPCSCEIHLIKDCSSRSALSSEHGSCTRRHVCCGAGRANSDWRMFPCNSGRRSCQAPEPVTCWSTPENFLHRRTDQALQTQ